MKAFVIKSGQIDYVIVFLMVVMSAGVSFLGNPIFRLLLLVLAMAVIFLRGKSVQLKNFKYMLAFYMTWFLAVVLYFNIDLIGSGQIITYFSFFTLVLASFFATVSLNNFFKTFVKVIYHLTLVSFLFYAIQLTDFSLLEDILRSFDGINSIFKDGEISRPSIIIATYGFDAGFTFRNYGFATEPGEFSVFLIVALMFQVTLNNFKLDRVAAVLIVGVISTISTAGYFGLIIFIIYVLYNKSFKINKIWFAIIGIPSIFIILSQEVVLEKVQQSWERETIRYEQAYSERITPGRICSMMLDFEDFKKNPIIGYGIHYSTRYSNYGGVEQQRTNGVTDYLVKFGLFGFLIMLYNFHKTFRITGIAQTNRDSYFLILSIMVVAFAQGILVTPLFLALQFYHFQYGNKL